MSMTISMSLLRQQLSFIMWSSEMNQILNLRISLFFFNTVVLQAKLGMIEFLN